LALEKRQELIAAGYSDRDLFLAVGYQHEIGLHAVLIAHTERGDYVLDSRTPYITTWQEAPYIWLLRQAGNDPSRWARVETADASRAAASVVASADIQMQTGS
jgi:predicted transglutaminase-like cysteine proteinase